MTNKSEPESQFDGFEIVNGKRIQSDVSTLEDKIISFHLGNNTMTKEFYELANICGKAFVGYYAIASGGSSYQIIREAIVECLRKKNPYDFHIGHELIDKIESMHITRFKDIIRRFNSLEKKAVNEHIKLIIISHIMFTCYHNEDLYRMTVAMLMAFERLDLLDKFHEIKNGFRDEIDNRYRKPNYKYKTNFHYEIFEKKQDGHYRFDRIEK